MKKYRIEVSDPDKEYPMTDGFSFHSEHDTLNDAMSTMVDVVAYRNVRIETDEIAANREYYKQLQYRVIACEVVCGPM